MTDNENIEALDNLHKRILGDESFLAKVNHGELSALFHIKRILELQNAEIERLKEPKFVNIVHARSMGKTHSLYRAIYTEAIKEFAERLQKIASEIVVGGKYKYRVVTTEGIDNLVKEMVGE